MTHAPYEDHDQHAEEPSLHGSSSTTPSHPIHISDEFFQRAMFDPNFAPEFTDPEIHFAMPIVQEQLHDLAYEAVIAVEWIATDAALHHYLTHRHTKTTIKRHSLSAGSARYEINVSSLDTKRPIGVIDVQAVPHHQTYVLVQYHVAYQKDLTMRAIAWTYLRWHLWRFLMWMEEEAIRFDDVKLRTDQELLRATTLLTEPPMDFPAPSVERPKRRGPPPLEYNQWAREQVRAGRLRDDILLEYMERRGEDFFDDNVRRRAREALRKTLARDSSGQ